MPIKHYVFQTEPYSTPLRQLRSRLMSEVLTRVPTPSDTQLLEDSLKALHIKEKGDADALDLRTPLHYSEDFNLLYSNLDTTHLPKLELVVRGAKEDFDILASRIVAPDIELLRFTDVANAVYSFTVQRRTCKPGLVGGYEKMVKRACPNIELEVTHYLGPFDGDRYKISCVGPVEQILLVHEMTQSNGSTITVKNENLTFLTAVPKLG